MGNELNKCFGKLHDEISFYKAFRRDLFEAKGEVIIFTPFVTKFRSDYYRKIFRNLRDRNIEIFIFTRPSSEYELIIQPQIEVLFRRLEKLGVHVFHPGKYIHQKAAIIDRNIVWE